MTDDRAVRRVKIRRFTAPRRATFLEHLRRTGNAKAAARAVGLHVRSAERRRERDAAFAIAWAAAVEEAGRRLAGATDPFDGVADAGFETIRLGRRGRPQIVATRAGKWSKAAEQIFLDGLRGCGNVAAAARAAGFSESLIWQRRRTWPGFAARMEEALDEAEIALEFRLACLGNPLVDAEDEARLRHNRGLFGHSLESGKPDLIPGEDAELRRRFRGDDAAGFVGDECDFVPAEEASSSPAASSPPARGRDEERFDPELALRFLKWRDAKKRGRSPRGGRPEKRWTFDESIALLDKKLKIFGRRHEAAQLAEGWSKDEDGRMIPPGWIRVLPGGRE